MANFGYEALARGNRGLPRAGLPVASLPDIFSPATQFPKLFTMQSYHSSTLFEAAILPQSATRGIVASTEDASQESGYALGLHPSSQTPIAVQFFQGAGSASAVLTLKPGQVITPFGNPVESSSSQFTGFRYGLPMGWLGGGLATLVVFHTPEASVQWSESAELIFHKVTVPILALANITAAANNNARRNWPLRFPWSQATQGSLGLGQASNPVLAVTPTKVAMVLRGVTTLANAAAVRAVFQATNDFGLNSAGAVVNTSPIFEDTIWDAFVSIGTSGNLSTQNPVKVYGDETVYARMAADDGGLALIDNSGASAFGAEGVIDFVRYGRL